MISDKSIPLTDTAKLVVTHACYVIATVFEGDEVLAALAPRPSLQCCELDELQISMVNTRAMVNTLLTALC